MYLVFAIDRAKEIHHIKRITRTRMEGLRIDVEFAIISPKPTASTLVKIRSSAMYHAGNLVPVPGTGGCT
jgi:hypothetical protein